MVIQGLWESCHLNLIWYLCLLSEFVRVVFASEGHIGGDQGTLVLEYEVSRGRRADDI